MSKNPVLESTRFLVENPQYVTINQEALNLLAEKFAKENLEIPSWHEPAFPEGNTESTIDFFMVGNSINFAYTDFKTGTKYASEFQGKSWSGAYGMWAALRKAMEKGVPILDGSYLASLSEEDAGQIFLGNIEIPLFSQRVEILREVGTVLNDKYDGHFYNLVKQSNERLFNDGNGIVERLVRDFSSFDDSVVYNGQKIRFDKRAQLAPGSLFGRFRNQGIFQIKDIDEITIFADYVLPKGFRDMAIFIYEPSLAERVDNGILIDAGSREELEIRASTIHAAKILQDRINQINGNSKITALHIDYALWSESRVKKGRHHLTITTAY